MTYKKNMNSVDILAVILVIIGAINWGLTVLDLNLVTTLQNVIGLPILGDIVYSLVGLAGLYSGVRLLSR
ncbi:MAG: DUF378 domain-containing protein [Halanaerobiales bacterium]